MVKTWILVYRVEKVTYLSFYRSLSVPRWFFWSFSRVFRVRLLVFFMSISWFLSFYGYFLSVSGFDSSRLIDCFLTVTGCLGLHRECLRSIQALFSCQPRDCFLDFWALLFFFKNVSWVFIFFSPDCYQSLSGQFHVCCLDSSEGCFPSYEIFLCFSLPKQFTFSLTHIANLGQFDLPY